MQFILLHLFVWNQIQKALQRFILYHILLLDIFHLMSLQQNILIHLDFCFNVHYPGRYWPLTPTPMDLSKNT